MYVKSLHFSIISAIAVLLAAFSCAAQDVWDVELLRAPPKTFFSGIFDEPNVDGVYFQGADYKGEQTRIFAWVGLPESPGGMAPMVVLLHGEGETANADWVRKWTARGYAAIAPDLTGKAPTRGLSSFSNHDHSGPDGWGGFDKIDEEITDNWVYHAVTIAISANSLLRSYPEVDIYNTGVVGVSWGGAIASIAASVDSRFNFLVSIYGSGFIHQDSAWSGAMVRSIGREKANQWAKLWDPSSYLRNCRAMSFWVTGTNNRFFSLNSFQRSYTQIRDSKAYINPDLGHSHEEAFNIEEVYAFADYAAKGAETAVIFTRQGIDNRGRAYTHFGPETMPESAVMVYTEDLGAWQNRRWQQKPAHIDNIASTITSEIPENARVYFFNATDSRGLISSSRFRGAPRQ